MKLIYHYKIRCPLKVLRQFSSSWETEIYTFLSVSYVHAKSHFFAWCCFFLLTFCLSCLVQSIQRTHFYTSYKWFLNPFYSKHYPVKCNYCPQKSVDKHMYNLFIMLESVELEGKFSQLFVNLWNSCLSKLAWKKYTNPEMK